MLWLRQILRSKARPSRFYTGPQTITAPTPVRHVRFRRRWLRSFIGKCLLYGVTFHAWTLMVRVYTNDNWDEDPDERLERSKKLRVLKEKELLESKRQDKEIAEEEVEEDEPVFIPLTWYLEEQEGEFYTASDPEWQVYSKISKDREKLQKLRDELAAIILQSASEQISPFLGSPLSLTGLWLVPQFPSRPPPEYVRAGMELTDDGISWATKPMNPEIGDRLSIFMRPTHVALAIWDAYYVLYRRQMDRLMNPDGQPNDVQLLNGRFTLSSQPNPMTTREKSQLQPPISDRSTENIPSNAEPELHPSFFISTLQRLPLPDLGPGSDLHLASIAFKLRLHDHETQFLRTPVRGSFFFSGPVGVQGPHGSCRFEVRGEYDPAKPGWRTVDVKLKDLSYHKQRPLR